MSRSPLVSLVLRWAVPLGLLLVAGSLVTTSRRLDAYTRSPFPLSPTASFAELANLASTPAEDAVAVASARMAPVPVEIEIESGRTLDQMLGEIGLGPAESQAVVAAFREHCDLRRLHPGDTFSAYLTSEARPTGFALEVGNQGRVEVSLDRDGGWRSGFRTYRRERRLRLASGTIDGSLTEAVARSGAPTALAYKMADVLQWDLDFTRDLRQGDRFEVLYEEVLVGGQPTTVGDVLALSFENRGQTLEAYRFGDDPSYYDAQGRPLQKMFLRSPLSFTRITSRFSLHRFHPVLHVYRPHYGVDYHAAVGTPVHATARGTVLFAGRSGGSGNMVKIRHANGYVTAYLHLSRFARGVRSGARVNQGQVIAYSGATGLATAPHLDYRVQKSGHWIDPLSLKAVAAEALDRSDLDAFLAWRDALRESLVTGRPPAGLVNGEGEMRLASAASEADGVHSAGG